MQASPTYCDQYSFFCGLLKPQLVDCIFTFVINNGGTLLEMIRDPVSPYQAKKNKSNPEHITIGFE